MTAESDQTTRLGVASPDLLDASVRLARLRRRMFARVEAAAIAQYHVVRSIGGGGMGLVYAAWDPSLDRLVAIKVLRDPWTGGGEQLRREAVALARLRHPNVVAVYEVGEHEGQLFLVMEYVDGVTLREWMLTWRGAPRRDLRGLLRVFEGAARGLAAAHAAGVVHRDVKPENVMIDVDGRARWMDFGLARRTEAADPTALSSDGAAGPRASDQASLGASVSAVCGTPAYMAPEQFSPGTVGQAADQFALGACLFEALYGHRIRPARMAAAAAVSSDPIEIGADRAVSRQLRELLTRMLAVDPNDRFPSMEVVAQRFAALQRPAAARWVAAGGVTLTLAGLVAAGSVVQAESSRCDRAGADLAQIWDDDAAAAVRERLLATTASYAEESWSRLEPALDQYANAMVAAAGQSCQAARTKGEISQGQLELRTACLRDRGRHLSALVDGVVGGDAAAVAIAEVAADELPAVDDCLDADTLERRGYRLADDAITEVLREELAQAEVQLRNGQPTPARERALELAARARAGGRWRSAAEALWLAGRGAAELRDFSSAMDELREAYTAARRGALREQAADIADELARLSATGLGRMDQARWWMTIADVERGGADSKSVKGAQRQLLEVELAFADGRIDDGLTLARRLEQRPPGGVDNGRVELLTHVALARLALLYGVVDYGAALAERSAAALAELIGPEHPLNADAERGLGLSLRLRGQTEAALVHAQRGLALATSTFGEDHIALAPFLESLSKALVEAQRTDDALAALDRALALSVPRPLDALTRSGLLTARGQRLERDDPGAALRAFDAAYATGRDAVGEAHPRTLRARVCRASLLSAIGRGDEAREEMQAALWLGQSVLGSNHRDVSDTHFRIGSEAMARRDYEVALRHFGNVVEIIERTHGADAYPVVGPLVNICAILGQLQRPEEALRQCERAKAVAERAKSIDRLTPAIRADLHNNLASALSSLDRLDEAVPEFEKARRDWVLVHGPRSYEESIVISNLAAIARAQDNCERAIPLYREALAIRRGRLGDSHPAVAVPRDGLIACGATVDPP